jgi:hypothetical protein
MGEQNERRDELVAVASGCVIEGDLDGVNVATAFAVVHDADGNARGLSDENHLDQVARMQDIASLYPPGSFEAQSWTELADRLEAEVLDGHVTQETLDDVYNQRLEQGPLDDPVLGRRAVRVQSLGRLRPARRLPPPRMVRRQPSDRRRLLRVAPRRRERRAATRRTTRAGPAGRRSDDDEPPRDVAHRAEVRR